MGYMNELFDAHYWDHYDSIGQYLNEIKEDFPKMSTTCETARTLLVKLMMANKEPPIITISVSGDSIVLLWNEQYSTLAITINDNEWGYVLRQNKELLDMKSGLCIDDF